jgi:hypothetical protein
LVKKIFQPLAYTLSVSVVVSQLFVVRLGTVKSKFGATSFRRTPVINHLAGNLRVEFNTENAITIGEGLPAECVASGKVNSIRGYLKSF